MNIRSRKCGAGDCSVTELRPMEQGKIGVVTVTYNSEPVLQDFFDSLMSQTHTNFVLYIVDNASHDQTLPMARMRAELAPVIIANRDNVGVAEGNNQGIRAALDDGCECVLLLNNDTVFSATLFECLYNGLDQYSCDMTTCKIYYHDQPNVLWYAGGGFRSWQGFTPTHCGFNQQDSGEFDRPCQATYAPTCCLLIRRTVFDRVGMMDSSYFAYYDDTDFLLRCMRKGKTLWYMPKITLLHKVSSLTSRQPAFAIRLLARNRIYFIRKHMPGFSAYLWFWLENVRFVLEVLLRRSSFEKLRLQRVAAREGWAMPLQLS